MSAPTTAEVRERLATAGLVVARASGDEREREAVTMAVGGGSLALKTYALPIAEHRDALAAEVARLREALAIACHWWGGCEHHTDDCPGVADRCKAAKRVNELAAKGAGR